MATGVGPPWFVGRSAEVTRLHALAREAAAGRGAAVLVDGEPGIGKTTLLDRAERHCTESGLRVLRGGAEDLEQGLPFAAIGACLGLRAPAPEPAVARLVALLRGEGIPPSTAAANHEFAVTEAILDLVDGWCTAGPVALLMDDAQWADPSSVVALHRLARGIAEQPLLLLIAGRALASSDATAGLVRSLAGRGADRMTLGELTEDAVTALVERLLGAPVGPRLSSLIAGAGGNPFYLTELIAALRRDGLLDPGGDLAGGVTASGWMPRSLVEVILQRLDVLSREERRTLQMAAVLGSTINVAEVANQLDVSVPALSHVVVSALDAGLLRDTGDRLEFRHDLIREVLTGQLPASVRVALHLRAGQLLAAQGAPVERVAEHLLVGTELEPRTVEWLVESAGALTVRAPHLAVGLLRRALATVDGPTASTLRVELVRALLWEGGLAEAEQHARAELAANRGTAREAPLRWLLLQALYRQGRLADVVAVASEAVEDGRVIGFAAICQFYLERFEAGEAAARRAIELGVTRRDADATGLGNIALAAMRFAQGDMQQALEHNERAVGAFESGIQPDFQVDPYAMRGYCLFELDRYAEADEVLAVAAGHNRHTGGVYLAVVHALRARLRFIDGRWDDALAEIETGLDGPDPLDQAPGLRGLAALIAVHRGTPAEIPEPPEDSIGGRKYGYLSRWAHALLEEGRSGPQRALDLLYPAWEQAWGLDSRRVVYRVCPDIARLAALAGDDKRAADVTRGLAAVTDAQPTNGLRATVALCRGLASGDPEQLFTSAQLFGELGWPLYEAQAHENAAAVLAKLGRTAPAREALDRALTLYAALDAVRASARAEARLRQTGIRRGVQGPRRRPKHGWAALTDTERRVAELVAEGRSNADIAQQMFLSRRTVQTHVSNILAKLELTSRVELAITTVRRTG